jgi:uncharacterized protein (TIGR02186 family)
MRAARAWLLAALLMASGPAHGQPRLVTDLSDSQIDISYRFAGAELLVFGAIQYPGGRTPAQPPGIAIVLRGPATPQTVRLKERVAGIWVNTRAVRFESAPGYYAVATTEPIGQLLDERNAAIHEIGLKHLQLSPATPDDTETVRAFEAGLVSLREREGLFVEKPTGVQVADRVLYSARLPIPSSVPVGDYEVQIFLIGNGEVRARSSTPIRIDKTGFERDLFVFAHERSFLYGLSAVAISVALGGLAGLAGRRRATA